MLSDKVGGVLAIRRGCGILPMMGLPKLERQVSCQIHGCWLRRDIWQGTRRRRDLGLRRLPRTLLEQA